MDEKRRTVVIKSYMLKELADIYGISLYLMRKAIKKHRKAIGKLDGYYYQTEQVELMFQLIKLPSNVDLVTRH